jgi:cell division protein FtsQ
MWVKRRAERKKQSAPSFSQVDFLRGYADDTPAARRTDSVPVARWFTRQHMANLANFLFLIALCLAAFIGYRVVSHLNGFALRRVDVVGELRHANPAEIERAVRSLRGNFLTLDLEHARKVLTEVSWLRDASLERSFPNRLRIRVEEHRPLARWRLGGLVNTFGEPFDAAYAGALPVFDGARERAAEISERYADFKTALEPLGLAPRAVTLSPRQAWRVQLDRDLTLELGREKIAERLRVFVGIYPEVIAPLADAKRIVDLRYANGFTITANRQEDLPPRRAGKQGREG